MKQILLTNSTRIVLVDDVDFEYLSQYNWSLHTEGYAQTCIRGKITYMHRLVAKTPKGLYTDHINRNKLDNRKENLRICNARESQCNSKKPTGMCPYRGVTYDKRKKSNPYVARIKIDKYHKHLGVYATAEEAALAYNEAAKEVHGEFAILNEILYE